MGTELADRMAPGWRCLRRILPLAAILVGFSFIASCKGDTLYDPAGEEEPPTPDAVASAIRVRLESRPRLEMTDEIPFSVSAVNNPLGPGIARLGLTALVRNTARSDTVVLSASETVAAGRDTVTNVFTFELPAVDEVELPDTLHVAVSGLAFDARGNCAGGVQPEFEDAVGCETLDVAGSEATVAVAEAEPLEIVIVRERASLLPVRGGTPADLVVDVERSRAYVSDVTNNRVHTLNTPLFEIERKVDDVTKVVKLDGRFIDFSDRPQFIAEDARGKLLYSTRRPTPAASAGTIRVVRREPGWDVAESRILLATGTSSSTAPSWRWPTWTASPGSA